MLEQAGEQHTSRFAVIPQRTEAGGKEIHQESRVLQLTRRENRCWKEQPEQRSIFPWTAEPVLNTVLQSAPASLASLSGQLCVNQLEEKNTGCGIVNTSNGLWKRKGGGESASVVFYILGWCVRVCVCVCAASDLCCSEHISRD